MSTYNAELGSNTGLLLQQSNTVYKHCIDDVFGIEPLFKCTPLTLYQKRVLFTKTI